MLAEQSFGNSEGNYVFISNACICPQSTLYSHAVLYLTIITPAAPGQAPRDLMNTGNAIFNGYWTMMGVPAITLPFLKGKDNLPIGIQFIADWSEDLKLLEMCKYILKKEKLAD